LNKPDVFFIAHFFKQLASINVLQEKRSHLFCEKTEQYRKMQRTKRKLDRGHAEGFYSRFKKYSTSCSIACRKFQP